MTSPFAEVLRLPAVAAQVVAAAAAAGRPTAVESPPPLTVAVLGASPTDRRRLLRGLLGPDLDQARALPTGHDELRIPVEYAHGPQLRMLRMLRRGAGTGPRRYTPGRLWDRGDLDGDHVLGARLELPAPLLASWGIRLVELPSADHPGDLTHDRYRDLWAPDTAVFYVASARQLTTLDERMLERLRGRPVAVLVALAEEELTPRRSELRVVPQPSATVPFLIQLVASRIAAAPQRPAETALLDLCLATLRAAATPPARWERLRRTVEQERAGLRDELARESAAIRADPGLAAFGRLPLLRARARALVPLDDRLTELATAAGAAAGNGTRTLTARLEPRLDALVRRYNIDAAARVTGAAPREGRAGFADRYARNRRELMNVLTNMAADELLGLTGGEREAVLGNARAIADNRIRVATLGGFSTGKSSLINALLGVANSDRERVLLPTSVTRETATVNNVEHAATRQLLGVDWLEDTVLTFLSRDGDLGYKVHQEELKAFADWRRNGEVADDAYEFTALDRDPGDDSLEAADGETAYRALLAVRPSPNGYVYDAADHEPDNRLPDAVVAGGVRIGRFTRPVARGWPANPSLDEAFEAMRDSSIALRVHNLRIGHPHELLHHMSFTDTPGTDAPVPHHRRMARSIVQELRCPVVYCFDGSGANAGRADQDNLAGLREWTAEAEYQRIFFVITKRAHNRTDPAGTERHIRTRLAVAGFRPRRLYFVEVVEGLNDAFHDLVRDLGTFIRQARRPSLVAALERAGTLLDEAAARWQRQATRQRASAEQREAARQRLTREAAAITAIGVQLETSTGEGRPWTLAQLDTGIDRQAVAVDHLLSGLDHRKDFEDLKARLRAAAGQLERDTAATVDRVCAGLVGAFTRRVNVSVSDYCVAYAAAKASGADALFPATDLLDTAGDLSWTGLWLGIFGRRRQAREVVANRELLRQEWRRCRAAGETNAREHLHRTMTGLRQEHARIGAAVGAELAASAAPLPAGDAARLRAQGNRAPYWGRRLRDLRTELENHDD